MGANAGEAEAGVLCRVLGPLEVAGHSGHRSLDRSVQLRRLLAALVLHRGSVVSVDRLAGLVWPDPDAAPDRPRSALHTLMSRLRGPLDEASGLSVLTRPPGYVLSVADDALDASRFERLVRLAGRTADDHDAIGHLDMALRLWRGAPYAEFADEDFVRGETARLAAIRQEALDEWADRALALGREHEVIARLEPVIATDPYREPPGGS